MLEQGTETEEEEGERERGEVVARNFVLEKWGGCWVPRGV